MKLRIEADPGELEAKASTLILELARKLTKHDAGLCAVVELLEKSALAKSLEPGEPAPVGAFAEPAPREPRHPMRRTTFAGLPIAIEFPAGSMRNYTIMRFDYGFIEGTRGADGDGYDCFLGPCEDAPFAYVVHQRVFDAVADAARELYDEDKCFLGFHSAHEADRAYRVHYPEDFIGSISQIPMAEFVEKLQLLGPDGMMKSSTAPRYVVKASLNAEFAVDPVVGSRAVETGALGANLAMGAPMRPEAAPTSIESPDSYRSALDGVAEERGETEPIRRDKEVYNLRTFANRPIHPPSEWEDRIVENTVALDQSPGNLEYVESMLERRQWGGNAPTQMHPRDPRPRLLVPVSKSRPEPELGAMLQKSLQPELPLVPENFTFPSFQRPAVAVPTLTRSVSVEKDGLGEVTLDVYAHGGFSVRHDDRSWAFGSLSAACDHVWAMQKGFTTAADWKKATGKRKLPSGAGWRFWGLDPKEMSS